jgi:DNA repair photolyase
MTAGAGFEVPGSGETGARTSSTQHPAPDTWAVLDRRRRGTQFIALPFRAVLNSPQQTGMDFWSVNPYVGCEFGCRYCYARFAHQYVVERAGAGAGVNAAPWSADDFERRIFVKAGAAEVLALTLRPARLGGRAIVIGTATDPYQPAERTFRVTRALLERMTQVHGLHVGLITKSPLVTRDIDVLRRLGERSRVTLHVSMIGVDAPLVRRLEPRSPVPAARLRALEQLVGAGLHAGVMLAPVLPGITDGVPHLEALMRAAREAGAHFVRAEPLRLYPGIRRRFLPAVAEHYPHLTARYESAFDARGIVRRDYAAALQRRIARLRQKWGVPSGREDGTDPRPIPCPAASVQEELPL